MKKINPSKTLYYISYLLILIYYMCGQIVFMTPVKKIIYMIIPLILLCSTIIQAKKYSLKSIILILLCLITFFISYLTSKNSTILLTLIFIISSKNINIEEFIKYDLKMKLLLTIIVVFFYSLGLTNIVLKYRIDGTIRYALGFGHPNVLGAILFSICSDIILLNYKKLKLKDYIIILISFLICTFVCDSRASQIGIISLLLLSFIFPKIEKNKLIHKLIPLLPFIFLTVSYICALEYETGNDLVLIINKLTSTRVKCASDFLKNYGINFFGHYFEYYGMWDVRSYLTVLDNSYMNILLQFGIITASIVLTSLFLALKKAIKEKKYSIIICLVALALYGLMENYSYMIGYNAVLIYISNLIYERGNKNEENSNNNIPFIV